MESRRNIKSRLAAREKEQKEAELREMAAKSRMARAGLAVGAADDDDAPRDEAPRYEQREDGEEREDDERGCVPWFWCLDNICSQWLPRPSGGSRDGDEEDEVALKQREKLRYERRKEREREMRLDNMKGAWSKKKRGGGVDLQPIHLAAALAR